MPGWPNTARGVPNSVLRSALFGAFGRGKRKFLRRERIASIEGISIFYTGQRLDQSDLNVWEGVLHLSRNLLLGEPIHGTWWHHAKTEACLGRLTSTFSEL